MIPIAKPLIGAEEQAAVAEVLNSGMLVAGPRVREFEHAFAQFCGAVGGVACSSGTAGLCVAVQSLDLPPGTKVLTSPFSFIATANCVRYAGGWPVFADVDPQTFNLTAEGVLQALESDPGIRAVIAVHLYGQPCEIHDIVAVARERGVAVIEDCAQAHGATERGVPVGGIGDLAVYSFYPTKNMTTGEGGMITGRNEALLERCRLIVDHGAPSRYQHEVLGFNFRMTSIAAAIGLCQLRRLPSWNGMRRRNAAQLSEGLAGLAWLATPFERTDATHVYHQYVICTDHRESLAEHLKSKGVATAVHYPRLIPDQPLYRSWGYTADAYPAARRLAEAVLSLPVHPALASSDVSAVVEAVRAFQP